jgi:cell fate regulator YaaT (PSP1 superfamily)
MPDYAHVSIKMAKNQNLSLNPTKISGLCGRLMCCLSYENEVYSEKNKKIPPLGAFVITKSGKNGVVVSTAPLKESFKLKITDGDKTEFADFTAADVVSFKTKGNPNKKPDGDKAEKELEKLE